MNILAGILFAILVGFGLGSFAGYMLGYVKAKQESYDEIGMMKHHWMPEQECSELLKEHKSMYNDLIQHVINVVPGETRHETARRIIREHENRIGGPSMV